GDGLLGLPLGAHEENALALRRELLNERGHLVEELESLLQVNDVDAVALAEDVLLHLRVPTPGLVPEVDSGLQQFLHRDFYQANLLLSLALTELETSPGALLTILLALLLARVAGQEAGGLQPVAQLDVELEQSARDAVPDRSGLARAATPGHGDGDVELLHRLRQLQGLLDDHFQNFIGKVDVEGAAIDLHLAGSRPQVDASRCRLAASGSVVADLTQCDLSRLNPVD